MKTSTTTAWDGSRIETDFDACVPNSAVAGDTFTLALPVEITNWDPAFTIYSGAVPALDVSINTASPAVATFTLTSPGAALNNLCFQSWFGGHLANTTTGSHTLTYRLEATTIASIPLEVVAAQPLPNTGPTSPEKYASFETADQCRTTATTCMSWYFKLPMGDHGIVTIEDPAGVGWSWDCNYTQYSTITYDPAGVANPTFGPWTPMSPTTGPVKVSCTPSLLTISFDTTGFSATKAYQAAVDVHADRPGGLGGVLSRNEATLTIGGTPHLHRQRNAIQLRRRHGRRRLARRHQDR